MSRTESTMLALGTVAPNFELLDVSTGKQVKFDQSPDFIASVIMFICNHCPYVKHINSELTRLANDYLPKGVRFLAISSNDVENYPDDSPENMIITAKTQQYPFPYLYDETQEVASAYHAACTPDFFVFDKNLSLIYRGQLDDSRPGNAIPVTGDSIRMALNCLIENKPLNIVQKPSLGCNIKWKAV
ncbi:thioredoxin family protein [Legionella bononiensis]|uniref:thioredoxin family protein n=1 Tax=Legionella bononiensis TaxID=2793102 RepID=UPI0019329798|nr:thioredoxin family protein [Legionella bononiensis]MBL7478844.1 thioredoxin family protein [Legionella bononiensis]MBL7562432.1 thioredoxin family protein [Legionella bononiensis]